MNEVIAPAPVQTAQTPAAPPAAKKRIYIVEDEAILALDLAERLTELGYDVCGSADNAAKALLDVSQLKPDLVLMDMHLKGETDGIEAAEVILRTRRTAVVFLTAYSDPETIARATEVAPYGYLTKPLQPQGLKPAIEVALRLSQMERRLSESEHWYAATLRGVADGVVATDAEGAVCFMNPAAERLTQWPQAQALGVPAWQVLNFRDAGTGLPTRQEGVLRDGHVRVGDVLVARTGQQVAIDHSQSAIRDEVGELLGAVTVLRDVSAGRAADVSLQYIEERFRIMFEASPIGMAMVARDGRFLRLNAALAELLHYPPAALAQMKEQELSHPEDRHLSDTHVAQLRPGATAPVQFAKRYVSAEGNEIDALVSVALVPYDAQSLCYLYQVRVGPSHHEHA